MENGIYWVWKDVARGKDPDNFITVTGTEFYDIMRSSHGRRHYIRLRGEQASETLYLEVTREDYERHAYELEHERYLETCWRDLDRLSLEGRTGDGTLADQIVDETELVDILDRKRTDLQFDAFMATVLAGMDEQDAYIAENRYLTEAPVTIQEIAAHLHRSLTETHRRITRVQELLLEAMHEYNPPLYERYERRAAYC